ncbi:mobile mystery protein A [Sulfuriferula sp.]|uniref:mobile mystery protein A n=1 Tax=Sulfuriferula sp. TaxID=2025307 RepID=UPI00272FC704|nr:mobile mystery protein A [Sulfuriferula sp.]MDP2025990.1 mobile mystery protein A [Sulfuriferula sp.]
MNKRFQHLQLHQTDAMLTSWRDAHLSARPQGGWVRAIREALGMTATALARRLGMSHAGIRKLEINEAEEVITLASLRKLANALDCELQYALVPRTSLEQMLKNRAHQIARERLRPVSHSMSLEDQSVEGASSEVQLELLTKEILDGSRRELW